MSPQSEHREFDPPLGTTVSRFLWVICVSLCRASNEDKEICKLNATARAQFKINTVDTINTCSVQAGCQFSSAALAPPLELSFWDSLRGLWNRRAGKLAVGGVASVSFFTCVFTRSGRGHRLVQGSQVMEQSWS